MADDTFHHRTQDFLSWFRSQPGTTFHHDIEIRDLRQNGAGRGVIATAPIPADTVLFTIPRATILSKETSPLTALLPTVFNLSSQSANHDDEDHDMNTPTPSPSPSPSNDDDETTQDSWTTLILILIHAHLAGPASPWAPYLALLPQSPADFNTPMFWTAPQIAELQASPVVDKIGRADADAMIRAKILPVIRAHPAAFVPPGTPTPTDDELIQLAFRFGSVIMAYAFDLDPSTTPSPSPDPDPDNADGWAEDHAPTPSPLGMVPLADLLNADAAFNTHIEHTPAALTATTLRAIAPGDEILNYYGPLGTGELVRRYGYATQVAARWDLVDLGWEAHVLPAVRAELGESAWERVPAGGVEEDDDDDFEESFLLEYPAADPDSEGRVAPVTAPADVPEELAAQLKALLRPLDKAIVPSKTARDKIVYGAVGRAVAARAAEYATTLEADEEALLAAGGGGAGWDARRRMAVAVRMGEKRVLREVGQSVARRLAVLSLAERDGDGRSAKRRKLA